LQVADMIAGMALDEATGRSHRYLARLEEKLKIIHVRDKKTAPASWGCFCSGPEHLKPNPHPSVRYVFTGGKPVSGFCTTTL